MQFHCKIISDIYIVTLTQDENPKGTISLFPGCQIWMLWVIIVVCVTVRVNIENVLLFLSLVTILVHFGDIFNLFTSPGGQDLNQHVVISPGALGNQNIVWINEYCVSGRRDGSMFSQKSFAILLLKQTKRMKGITEENKKYKLSA